MNAERIYLFIKERFPNEVLQEYKRLSLSESPTNWALTLRRAVETVNKPDTDRLRALLSMPMNSRCRLATQDDELCEEEARSLIKLAETFNGNYRVFRELAT
jgi:hypothetical protein